MYGFYKKKTFKIFKCSKYIVYDTWACSNESRNTNTNNNNNNFKILLTLELKTETSSELLPEEEGSRFERRDSEGLSALPAELDEAGMGGRNS